MEKGIKAQKGREQAFKKAVGRQLIFLIYVELALVFKMSAHDHLERSCVGILIQLVINSFFKGRPQAFKVKSGNTSH